jgi:hypothetical protein
MFTPEARHSGIGIKASEADFRAAARVSGLRLFTVKELQQSRLEKSRTAQSLTLQVRRAASRNFSKPQRDVIHAQHVPGVSPQMTLLGVAAHPASALDCAQSNEKQAQRGDPLEIIFCASGGL